jgi:outer membrane protein
MLSQKTIHLDAPPRLLPAAAASRASVLRVTAVALVLLAWPWLAAPACAGQPGPANAAAPAAPPSTPPAAAPAAAAPTPAVGAVPSDAGPATEVQRIAFRDAVDRALGNNTTVQEAVAEVLRAEALIKQSRAIAMPQVSATAGYTRYQYSVEFGGVVFQPNHAENETGKIAVPLVNLVNWAGWAHAIDNRVVAELSVADAKRRVAQAAANAYLQVLARHRTLEANQRAQDTAKAHLDIAHQRQVAGAASRLEEVQAAQDVSNDEVLVQQAAVDLRRAQEALGVLLSADAAYDAADEPVFADLGSIADSLAGVEQRRADLKVLAMRENAAENVLRDTWREFAPTLDLSFQEMLTQPRTAFTLPHSWQAQLLLTVPIYEGGLRKGHRDERQALVQEAQANLTGGKVQARSDVRIASDAIRFADQGLAAASNAAHQAHEALDIVNLSYRAGASTSLDVLDAQRRARDADTAVANAEDAARQARLDFLVGSGKFP